MDDRKIIEFYFARDEAAILHTAGKYGAYCFTIAYNILYNNEDSEECVNDTYLRAWNAIPPERPNVLKLFLAKITRNLAINKYNAAKSIKRAGEVAACMEELDECASSESAEEACMLGELSKSINRFLATLTKRERCVFLRRYFYSESNAQIGARYGMKESNVRLVLFRVRGKLKEFLAKEGFLQ